MYKLIFEFMAKQLESLARFFSNFKLGQLAGIGANVVSIIVVIPNLIKHSDEIGWALKVMFKKNNFALLKDWQEKHPGKTPGWHLFYEFLKLLTCFIYVPVAIAEIYAIWVGASLAATLPFTLTIGYTLFMAYDAICLFELSDQWRRLKREAQTLENNSEELVANSQKRKELQNELITKGISLFLFGAGLVFGLIGLGLFPGLGLVAGSPILLGISISIIVIKVVNYFLPKDFLRKALSHLKDWILNTLSLGSAPVSRMESIEYSDVHERVIQSGANYGDVTIGLGRTSGNAPGTEQIQIQVIRSRDEVHCNREQAPTSEVFGSGILKEDQTFSREIHSEIRDNRINLNSVSG